MRKSRLLFLMIITASLFTSCAVVMQDQVAVKRKFGRVSDAVEPPGLVGYNPFSTKVIRVFIRTKNLAISENLPSREGLTIKSESSILYSLKSQDVPKVLKETGMNYERDLILPVYRSAAADVCSKFAAKDMHSSKRAEIEKAIKDKMAEILDPKGFTVEAVLLKSITLPSRVSQSIERKLEAEQEALRLEFVAEQQRKEVERKIIQEEGQREIARIEAEGEKTAQILRAEAGAESLKIEADALKNYNEVVNASITPNLLKLKQIEAYEKLATSPNAKSIITDSKTPLMNFLGGEK
ncbi:MAG: SPFH domain-containing protein [Crocinitomicaceae bacterium]